MQKVSEGLRQVRDRLTSNSESSQRERFLRACYEIITAKKEKIQTIFRERPYARITMIERDEIVEEDGRFSKLSAWSGLGAGIATTPRWVPRDFRTFFTPEIKLQFSKEVQRVLELEQTPRIIIEPLESMAAPDAIYSDDEQYERSKLPRSPNPGTRITMLLSVLTPEALQA